MKKLTYLFLVGALVLASCENQETTNEAINLEGEQAEVVLTADEAYDKIIELEENVVGANNVVSNSRLMELAKASKEFDKNYYDDERVEHVLQKGIRAYMSLNNYSEAIILMDKIIKNYGTDEKMPALLFQKAFIYSESDWLGEADKLYTKIQKDYPNSEYAEQSKLAQEILFLTPEELNERFSKK